MTVPALELLPLNPASIGMFFEILILKTKTVTSVRHYYQNIRRGKEKRKTKTHRCRYSIFENEV